MALLNGIMNDMPKYVSVGNRSDICEFCVRDLKAKNEQEYSKLCVGLKGKLEGLKVIKFTKGGTQICVCKSCLDKLVALTLED